VHQDISKKRRAGTESEDWPARASHTIFRAGQACVRLLRYIAPKKPEPRLEPRPRLLPLYASSLIYTGAE
jgi:hypothetical protein